MLWSAAVNIPARFYRESSRRVRSATICDLDLSTLSERRNNHRVRVKRGMIGRPPKAPVQRKTSSRAQDGSAICSGGATLAVSRRSGESRGIVPPRPSHNVLAGPVTAVSACECCEMEFSRVVVWTSTLCASLGLLSLVLFRGSERRHIKCGCAANAGCQTTNYGDDMLTPVDNQMFFTQAMSPLKRVNVTTDTGGAAQNTLATSCDESARNAALRPSESVSGHPHCAEHHVKSLECPKL